MEDMIRGRSGQKENTSNWILTFYDEDGWFVRGKNIFWQVVESVWAAVETILRLYNACTIKDDITTKEFQDHLFGELNTSKNSITK